MIEIKEVHNKRVAKKKIWEPNRLIVITRNPQCELCGAKGEHVHHKDNNRTNHDLFNLMVLCSVCHSYLHRRKKSRYSVTVRELAEKYSLSCSATSERLKKGVPLTFPKNMWSTKYTFKKQDYRRWIG